MLYLTVEFIVNQVVSTRCVAVNGPMPDAAVQLPRLQKHLKAQTIRVLSVSYVPNSQSFGTRDVTEEELTSMGIQLLEFKSSGAF